MRRTNARDNREQRKLAIKNNVQNEFFLHVMMTWNFYIEIITLYR